jgi:16S rRNA processing protein RimM
MHSDVPNRFRAGMRLFALSEDGLRREFEIEDLWPHKGHVVLKFAGVESISEAETLVGCELQVPAGERAVLEAGWSYISDLVGCRVYDGVREVGTLRDVRFGTGEAPLLVVQGDKEYEIPFAEAYLVNVDLPAKRIAMQLPEGLLDVNAPLTGEEKERQ